MTQESEALMTIEDLRVKQAFQQTFVPAVRDVSEKPIVFLQTDTVLYANLQSYY